MKKQPSPYGDMNQLAQQSMQAQVNAAYANQLRAQNQLSHQQMSMQASLNQQAQAAQRAQLQAAANQAAHALLQGMMQGAQQKLGTRSDEEIARGFARRLNDVYLPHLPTEDLYELYLMVCAQVMTRG